MWVWTWNTRCCLFSSWWPTACVTTSAKAAPLWARWWVPSPCWVTLSVWLPRCAPPHGASSTAQSLTMMPAPEAGHTRMHAGESDKTTAELQASGFLATPPAQAAPQRQPPVSRPTWLSLSQTRCAKAAALSEWWPSARRWSWKHECSVGQQPHSSRCSRSSSSVVKTHAREVKPPCSGPVVARLVRRTVVVGATRKRPRHQRRMPHATAPLHA